MNFRIDYRDWFNKSYEEQVRIVQTIRDYMERNGLHYLSGNEEALPCISCVVLMSSKFHPIHGSFIRTVADRATGKIEGAPVPKGEQILILVDSNQKRRG